jgi:hypothetical protein
MVSSTWRIFSRASGAGPKDRRFCVKTGIFPAEPLSGNPRSIRQPAEVNADEQEDTHQAPVDDEGPGREPFENPQQAPDRGKGRNRRDHEAEPQDRPAMRVEMRLVQFP